MKTNFRKLKWQNILIFSIAILFILTIAIGINAQTTKRMPERVIQEYLKKNNLNIKPSSSEYQILMKDILWGEYPELTALVGDREITDYALKQLNLKPDQDSDKLVIPKHNPKGLEKIANIPVVQSLTTSYNRTAAAQYADWAENGQKIRNSNNYPNFPNDCTNFVSQSVYAGGIPQYGRFLQCRK